MGFHYKKNANCNANKHFNDEFKRFNELVAWKVEAEYRKNRCMEYVFSAMRDSCYYTPDMIYDHANVISDEFYTPEITTALETMTLVGFVSKHELPD